MLRKITQFFKPESQVLVKREPEQFRSNKEAFVDVDKIAPENNEGKINLNIKTEVSQEFVINLPAKKVPTSSNSSEKSTISCQFCKKNFGSNFAKNQHLKNSHSSELDFKDVCDSKLPQKTAEQEQQTPKSINSGTCNYECDFDGKIFKYRDHLSRHLMVHLPTTKCHICHVELKVSYLHYHIKTYHETDQKFQCKICSMILKTQKQLKYHEKTHNKNFQCDICDRKFVTPFYLKKHKTEVHENPGSYECNVCNKKFNYKSSLMNHQPRHKDKTIFKTFECERCGFKVENRNNLKKHQKLHEMKDKKFAEMKNPLKCEKCPTLCNNQRAFYRHMRYVHPKQLYQCDMCAVFIKSKEYTVRHINKHIQRQNFKIL